MKHYFASFLRLCLLAVLLAGTFLQAPSTVYAAPNDISGNVIKDVEGDAVIAGLNDVGLQGVRVYLFRDVNGNNLPENSDVHLSTAVTNSSGHYSFTNALGGPLSALPNGTYWVVAETSTIDSLGATIEQTYGAAGVMIDPDSNSATETDFRASAGAAYGGRRMDTYDSFSSTNMDLNAAEHIIRIQLDGSTQHTNIDFGFGFIDSLMAGYSEFYVPAATDLVLEGMDTLNPTVGNSAMRIIISITTSTDNTTIFYDHWEDGYDFDPNNPYAFDDDGTDLVRQVVNGGTPEIFEGVNVPVLPRGSAVYYDFGDHIYITGGPVSVSVNYWVEATGTVYAMSWEMYPVKPFQTKYSIPGSLLRENNGGTGTIDIDGNGTPDVNEYPTGVDVNGDTVIDIPRTDYRDFETVLGFVQATEDGTVVTATDSFGNPMTLVSYNPATGAPVAVGTAPVLNKGQSVIVGQVFNGATPVGTKNGSLSATIVGSKPIQVTTLIGSDALGDYQSYGFSTTPSILWDDEYFLPVAFDGATNGDWATVYFNNQNPYAIRVHYESQTDSGVFTIPAYSIYDFEHLRDGVANDTPRLTNSAYRFVSEGGAKFSAFASFDVEDITRDWGINLVPGYILRNEYYLGWAPGANNYVADGTVPFPSTTGANGSPAWVTPRYDNTVIYYDGNFDGIADNPAGTSLNRYDSLKIYNASTDQSGLHIWATGPLAVAYGEDPATAGTGNPYMDLGYGLLPLPMDWMDVALGVIKTTDSPTIPNGISLPVNFTLSVPAWQAVSDLVITDFLPANWTYQPQSTIITLSDQNNDGMDEVWTYADTVNVEPSQSVVGTRTNLTWNVAQAPFGVSQLDPNERVTIKFTALTPSDPADIVNGYNQNDSEICGLRDLDGNSTPETYFCSEDYAYVFVSPVMIDKDTTTPVVQAGNNASYTLTVINTDANPVTGITLGDELPVGFTYVSDSATATLDGAPTTDPDTGAGGTAQAPEWSIGDIPGGSTYVLTFEALIDANTAAGEYDNDFWLDSTMPGISKFYDRGQTGQDPGTIMQGGINQDPEQDEDVLVIARTLQTEKGIIATSEVGTDAYEVAIGEVVRYRVQTQLPENSVTGFYVLDHVVAGMQLLDDSVRISVIDNDGGLTVTDTYGADDSVALNAAKETGTAPYRAVTYLLPADNLSTTLVGDTDDYTSTAATTGTDVYFKIGDIANTPNEANGEYVVIEYAAVVLNTTTNQQGKVLANYFTANINDDFNVDGLPDSVISNSVEVSVIEPVMNIAKAGTLQYSAGIAQMVYTITVSNPGSVSAYNLQVTDQLDTSVGAGKLDIEAGDIILSTSTGTVSGVDMGATDYVTETVNITIDELGGNSSAVFTVTADVTGAVDGDTIDINTANLAYTSLPGATGTPAASNPTEAENPGPAGSATGERTGADGVGGALNDYAAVATTPAVTYTPPSLSVDKTSDSGGDSDGIVNPGDTITYTITIENTGGTPLNNIVVTDLVPTGTTYVSGSVSGYTLTGTAGPFDYRDDFASASYDLWTGTQDWSGNSWTENGDNNNPASGTISVTGGELFFNNPNGDSVERTIGDLTGKVSVFLEIDVRETGTWDNPAGTATDDIYTVDIWDGSAWQTVSTRTGEFGDPTADIVNISAYANANTRIRIDTTNVGNGGANEDLYVNYVRIYYTDYAPVPFTGALPHAPANIIQSSDLFYLSATDGTAGSGPDFMTLTYTVTVNDPLAVGVTSIDNTVRVTSAEYTPVEVTDSVSDSVPQGIDVSLDKQVNNVAPSIGDVVTFTLTVANAGPRIATNINVTDVIPSGYTYVGSSIAGGNSRSDANPSTTGLTWTINSLAAGASVDLTYQATVLAAGTYDNYAEITSHTQTDLDSTPGNGSTTEDDDDTATVSPLVYSIGDFVWLDLDSDGVQDGGAEAGIPGVTVFLDLNNNDAIDGGEPTDVTDGNGLYQFTGLSAGTYTVRIDTTTLPAGYTQTYDLDATLDHETVVILPDALNTGGTITSLDALLGACIPGNCPPVGSYPPGILGAPGPLTIDATYRDDGFSAFIGGNFTVTNEASETEGRLAVGGDFVLQNPSLDYGVGAAGGGSNIYAPDGSNWMVVRGNVSSINPGVDTLIGLFTADGNAVIGGTASGIIINSFPPVGSINSGVGTSPAALGVDFDAIIADAQYKSALWSGLPATGTTNASSTLTFTGTNNPDFEVFTVPAVTSMSGVTVEFINVDPDATVLINVAGASRTVQISSTILPDSPLNQSRNHILYNFYEATSLTIAGGGDVDGSILVPNVTGTTTLIGNVNGRVVIGGNAIHQGGGGNEIHNWPFEGSLPSADFVDADFGYVPTGTLVITKDAIPDHAQDFAYTVTGTGLVPFSLDDDADATLSNTRTFASLTAGNYTVTETALAGWSLTGLTCTDPDSGSTTDLGTATATIDLDPGETVTCTFENNAALSIVTTKTADDTSIPETGQSVTYTVEIENTSPIDVTLDSLTDNLFNDITTTGHDNVTATTCVTGGTITAGATYSCTFTATVSGDFPGTHVNTITAQVSNGSNTTTDTDDETVTFEDVQPDITIVKTADDNSVPETGQSVTFTFTVTNNSSESATITALSDSDFTVTGDADCQVGTVLAAGASCDFTHTATISGDFGGADHLNTASVTVTDDDGNTDNDTDDETVTFEDVQPDITIVKTADDNSVPETGQSVTFTFTVTNNSSESATITALSDSDFTVTGDADCQVGTVLAAGASCDFTHTATISGDFGGADHLNTASVTVTDDDGNTDNDTDDETVTFEDVQPDITIVKTADDNSVPETGQSVTFTFTVTNNSSESATITALSDSDFAVTGDADCQVGTVLAAGASCDFTHTATISGDFGGADHLNTASVTVTDDDGNTDNDTDDETVAFEDVLPVITVDKTAISVSVPETGAPVTYTVVVTNTGTESVTLDSLTDDQFNDITTTGHDGITSSTCSTGGTIAPNGGVYSCTFIATVSGVPGIDHVNVVTADASDDDGNNDTKTDDATVSFTVVLGTVDGTVYLDVDGDGIYTSGIDTPLPNVDVTITDVNNTTYTVTTDVNGYFLQVVPAGDTDVDVNDADLPAGAALTTGSTDPTTVNVPAGGTATDDTGYIQQGTVDGTIYLDVDSDGIYTSGIDTPLSGVDVTITDVNNTTYTVTTDVNGYFSQVVPAGDTDVDVNDADLPAGAALTTGSTDPTTVNVPAGGTATDDTGYIQQGTVDGTVYLDVDSDGIYTSGIDTPLSGVDVTITDVNNTTYTVTTDVNGYFSQVVPAGDTDVDVSDADLPAGAALTTGSTDPTTVTVPAGGTATDDTGYIQQGTVDGTVYLDVDGDGIYTSGIDTPLSGVDVTITDVNNTTYTVTTDVNGYFLQVVPAGDTDVDVNDADLPAGAALTTGSTDPTTVNVPAGGTATDDTGYIQQGTVDGTVYLDVDGDGVYTSGTDTPLSGINVTITDVNNTTYTLTTDVNGYFSQVVPAGDTDVDVNDADLPAGAALTTGSSDPTTVNVPAGGTATDDTGYIQQGTVDGTVYLDVDNNGTYDAGIDTPLSGVDVTITDVNNTTYTVTTDVNGYFSQIVPAGDTDVDVNDADLPAGAALTTGSTDPTTVTVPAGGTATDDTGYIQQGTVDGTVYLDVDNNGTYDAGIDTPLSGVDVTITDVNNTTYTVTTDVNGYFSQIVPAGDTDVDVNDADLPAGAALTTGSTDPTTVTVPAGGTATDDTGYIQQGTVDGTVYLDVDGDGVYTSGTDTPLSGVDVTITDVNNTTYTVTTDVNGYFSQVVPAGDTDVDVNDADLPAGAALTTGSTDPTTVNVLAGGTATDDTGYIQQGTVDGTVYLDVDDDGIYTSGIDTPLPNVDVTITDVNNTTYTVTTDVNGYFLQVVPAGDTDVDVNDADLPAGAALTTGSTDPTTVNVPAGGTATDDTGYIQQGTVDGTVYLDVDGDGVYTSGTDTPLSGINVTITDVNNTTYTLTTDVNGYFSQVVPAGDTDVDVNDADLPAGAALTTGSSDPTTVNVPAGGTATDDTGYIQQGTVDGTVYLDVDNNGTYDAGIDTPLSGVDVTITDVNNTTYTVTTDVNGYFSQIVPAGDTDVDVNDADLPAGAALTTGSTDPTTVTVPAGGTATDDTGYIQQGTVDGTVYLDVDNNGTYDAGIDTPLSGVDVTITDVNNTTYTVTTDVNGYFSQIVPAGDTDVDVNDADLPAGAALTTGSTDPTTVTVPAGGTATDDTGYIQQGTVDGTVYLDVDGDGVYTSGTDTPLSGVDVTITDVNNTTYTVTTDVNGYFSQVVPAGDTDVDVNDADLPAGAALTTGSTDPTTVNVPAGGTATDDTGYIQEGTISGTVYDDLNGDGNFDAGEPGIDGVSVTLLQDTDGNGSYETTVATVNTVNGDYSFTNLLAGDYRVVETDPSGYISTGDVDGVNDNLIDVTLVAGTNSINNDFFDWSFADLSLTKTVDNTTPVVATNITFTLTVTNAFTSTIPATGVIVTDVIPSGFTYVSDIPSQGTYNDATGEWSVGTLAIGASATLDLTVSVNITGSYTNSAEITAALEIDPDSTPNNGPQTPDEDDDDSVTVTPTQGNPTQGKNVSDSSHTFTTGNNVAIGEIVTYSVTITVPPGVFDNAQLVDTMERGLSFMACDSIAASDPLLTTNVAGSFTGACSNPTVEAVDDSGNPSAVTVDVGRRVTFDLGRLENTSGADQTLTFVYTAVVLDSAANVAGTDLTNSAVWTSTQSGALPPATATVSILEPDLSIEKTANTSLVSVGSEITITLTIQHTGSSQTDAFDALVTDVLPVELELVAGTLECVSGAQDADTCVYDAGTRTIRAVWNSFERSGGNGQVTFRVRVVSLPPSGVSNTANVAWTSLPGDVSTPQNSNPFSTERDYDPASQIDVYGASDTLVLGVFTNALPATGFAPSVVTDPGIQREAYAPTGGLTVEIPSLGIHIPIAGVPLKNGEWDVSWLGNQAGWLEGSAFPSWSGNSVLTSHVYGSNGLPGPFVSLNSLKYGDKVIVHAYGRKYTYEIRTNAVVEPNDVSVFRHEEKAWLTLVTCKEYDEKTNTYKKRVVVRAVLVGIGWE